ncbi:MAG: cysteine--tRNA ligase [Proteobacteria bacterium]|nr:cysteine--tRNA ligase [Pseudomonadota bacterium]NIS70291.1 cysteine--tRNA ligase [Pseudomonadota bacterium]
MSLRIYNTLTQKKEDFRPIRPKDVRMYVCGVTVYDRCHIGHGRAAIIFDVIYRYLKYKGHRVVYVRNITDIDDKIINKANEEKTEANVIAERYIYELHEDMRLLDVLPPTHEPRATEHVSDIIAMIQKLLDNGYAYHLNGKVFFSVSKFKPYGRLSHKRVEELLAGTRFEPDEDKREVPDFALWKPAKPGEPSWPSPWGQGRPGWHIECSAMSTRYLGDSFDIHGGGRDLVFPHHENEIAQSEAATGKTFVQYFVHNGFVTNESVKMAKSLGNIVTIREVLEQTDCETVRLLLLSHHYRSPVDFSHKTLMESSENMERFYLLLKEIGTKLRTFPGKLAKVPDERLSSEEKSSLEPLLRFPKRFEQAMDDDFNTALAIGYFYDMARVLNRILHNPGDDPSLGPSLLAFAKDCFEKQGAVLGLFQSDPEAYLGQRKEKSLEAASLKEGEITRLIEERDMARKAKNWNRADEIRDYLVSHNIVLEDGPEGTRWRIKEF